MFEVEGSFDPYRGMNPTFVRKVWAKRRKAAGLPAPKPVSKGIVRRVWTEEERGLLLELMEEGMPRTQIAVRLGRSYDAVEGYIDRMRKSERAYQTTGR